MLMLIKNKGTSIIVFFLFILLVISFFIACSFGNVDIAFSNISKVIFAHLSSDLAIDAGVQGAFHDIVWLLRIPRIILAICVGAGLSICGVVMQAIVKNPLADPYILGVSSGASLGATVAILLGVGAALGENFVGVCAFAGAFAVSLLVLFIANLGGQANAVKLLLSGMALSTVCSAFSSFVVYFSNNMEGMQTIAYWLMGSLAGAKWEMLYVLVPLILLGTLFFWSQTKILNMMLLGDADAITLGYDLHVYRQIYLLVSSIIVGFIVYSAGMVGFVGLLVPHVVRMIVGSNHIKMIPLTALVGAIFLIWADLCCRVILPRTELPIGILVSMLGAPCFIYLMVKKTYNFGGGNQ